MLRSIIVLLSLMLFGTAALAETRVALVIGAGSYGGANALVNPANDARLVSAALRRSGFTVSEVRDPDRAAFTRSLATFRAQADAADVAIVYYAGHGVETGGETWLLPISVTGRRAADLPAEAIRAADIAAAVGNARKVRLVVIDACRDDPFGGTTGHATRPSAANVVTIFAAQAGAGASDGTADVSPFAAAFARLVGEPGLALSALPARLAEDVGAGLGRPQRPDQQGFFDAPDWTFTPMAGAGADRALPPLAAVARAEMPLPPLAPGIRERLRQFVIPGQAPPPKPKPVPAPKPRPAAPAPAPAAPAPYDFERGAWNLCEKGKSASPCEAYLAKYPNGRWADLAATRIKDIAATPVAAPRAAPIPAAPVVEDKEKSDWLLCQNSTAPGPCERYLETYPSGRWSTQARTRIANAKAAEADKIAADKARAAAAQAAAQQQAAAAQAAALQQAAAAQEKADWDACQTGSGPAACERFIAAHPTSVRAAAARDRVAKFRSEGEEATAWGQCQNSDASGACEAYLSRYPTGPHAAAAREMTARFRAVGEEKSAWAACQNADNALPCEKYLAAYRAGSNAAAATVLIAKFAKAEQDRLRIEQEKTAWGLCEAGKTVLPCNDYLRAFPEGRFADPARTRIRVLETAATEPEMVPALGLVVRRNDKGEIVIVSVQQFSSAMGNVFGGDVIVKINDQPVKPTDLPRQTIETALAAASGRVKLLIRRGPAAVTAVIRARP